MNRTKTIIWDSNIPVSITFGYLTCSFLFFLLLFNTTISFAQKSPRGHLIRQVDTSIHIDTDRLKDSIAFYSFSIRIEVNKIKNKVLVERVAPNDSVDYVKVKSYSALKKIDYSSIISRPGKSVIILPVAVIVFNYTSKVDYERKIALSDFSDRINSLFNYDAGKENKIERYVYLNPLIIYLDKVVYD
ncbi:hypothetical protein [Pedobacter gandavensis]|uniref:hypothetical protein n=1 Tax=Pedobacter gandavensis TaxID=2679963 RepID=UPI00292D8563|nr:hypothetical protein [Pedobacter gandavensis]